MKRILKSLFAISDEQAMWRVQTQDDHGAFALLVERWREKIRQLCVRMTGNAHHGEDLAQEVFARVFEKRRDFNPAKRFSTWVWRIALNRCYDELRRLPRAATESLDDENSTVVLDIVATDANTPRDALAAQEEAECVRQALLRLPENYRAVLVLRHYENLKLREIAEVLEVPEGTVNSRMAEALAQLTRLLEPTFAPEKKNTRGTKELLIV
ncbi:MAG TPA: sigma-70 family RNA polymerase sigma factor [Candidatus Limnocylindria bacterium]|nr:sigma-70 family RNA polymerase sigma factor [Candidatus Limnocylindria bacterium]